MRFILYYDASDMYQGIPWAEDTKYTKLLELFEYPQLPLVHLLKNTQSLLASPLFRWNVIPKSPDKTRNTPWLFSTYCLIFAVFAEYFKQTIKLSHDWKCKSRPVFPQNGVAL